MKSEEVLEVLLVQSHPSLWPAIGVRTQVPEIGVAYQTSERQSPRDQLAEGVQYISGQIHTPESKHTFGFG